MSNRYKLGILGGMGPLATAKLYERIVNLTDAKNDQDHIEMCILNNCTIPDRTKAIFENGESPVEKLVQGVNQLIEIGCDNFIVPCNTAHFFKDKFIQNDKINFIDMIDETIKYLKENFYGLKVCVLATIGTVMSNIYGKDPEVKINYPCEFTQKEVMEIIYQTKAGVDMFDKLQNLVSSDKYDVYLLACTELSIYKDRLDGNVVDAMDILAMKAIEKCGKKVKIVE